MAAQGSVKDWFTFVGGLNAEGGYFNTPERNWVAGDNIVPKTDGSVERRNGIDLEVNSSPNTSIVPWVGTRYDETVDTLVTTVGHWGKRIVVQHGYYLEVFDNDKSQLWDTRNSKLCVDLRQFNPNTDLPLIYNVTGTAPCSFAEAYGKLLVTSSETNPILLTEQDSGYVSVEEINVQIRDFKGIDTKKPIDTELTNAEWNAYTRTFIPPSDDGGNIAYYNLLNQGWTSTQINAYKAANGDKLPSNTKSWIWGKDSNDDFQAALLNKQDFGSSPAPKGRTILNLFYQNRNLGSAGSFEDETIYRSRFTNTAFFAGRAWYSGAADEDLKGNIYFSQILSDFNKVGNCYQENDPTSEIISDLLDSDGGVINIPDAGDIKAMYALGRGLLVLASDGVYAVSGIDGVFSAANYQVEKVTEVGCIAPKSVIVLENSLVYWSTQGIYGISLDQSGFSYSSQNISDGSIRTLYNEIPYASKVLAQGAYNSSEKEIYWLYNNNTNENVSAYAKTSIIALNTLLQSWHTHTLPTFAADTHYVTNVFVTQESAELVKQDVTAGGEIVHWGFNQNSIDEVYVYEERFASGKEVFKFTLRSVATPQYYKEYINPNEQILISTPSGFSVYSKTWNAQVTNIGGERNRISQLRATTLEHSSLILQFIHDGFSVSNADYYVTGAEDHPLHPNFTTVAHAWSLDGLHIYASQLDSISATKRSQFGYYVTTVPFSLSNITSFTVIDTRSEGTALYESLIMSDLKITQDYMLSMNQKDNVHTLQERFIPSGDGKPTTLTAATTRTFTTDDTDGNVFNFFDFNPAGTEIYLQYRNHVYSYNSSYGNYYVYDSRQLVIPLPAPFALTSLTAAAVYDADRYNHFGGNPQQHSLTNRWSGGNLIFSESGEIIENYRVTDTYIGFKYQKWVPTSSFKRSYLGATTSYNPAPELGIEQTKSNSTISFADFTNTRTAAFKFKDWYNHDGVGIDTEAYLVTGYQFADVGPARNKTGMYLTTYSKRTETGLDNEGLPVNPSSIKMQLRWDFTDDYAAGKWAVPVEVYRQPRAYLGTPGDITFEDGYPLVISKSKMRGRGKAVQFKFSSSDGYDMKLFGWTGTFVGNTNV
jgi:hypothetical protein